MKTIKQNIVIPSVKNVTCIADASDVFFYIDSDFKKWNTNISERETNTVTTEVKELTEDGTFAQIFTNPEKMYLSQEAIIYFCREQKDLLAQDSYTFFLFKVGEAFFVAGVHVDSGGELHVHVSRLDYDRVWNAESRRRIVVPQLALDPLNLSRLDTLEQRVEKLEGLFNGNLLK